MQLDGIAGVIDEYDKGNDQGSSLLDRDTPSRTVLFSSPETLAAAYSIRGQITHVLDTIWYQRCSRQEGHERLPELAPKHYCLQSGPPSLGASTIVITSVNQRPASAVPNVALPYDSSASTVPFTTNVNLAYLISKLESPQSEWSTARSMTLTVPQINSLRSALVIVAQLCKADPSANAISQLTATLEHAFLREDSPPHVRRSFVTWCSAVTQHFHEADGGVANADDSDTQDMEDGC